MFHLRTPDSYQWRRRATERVVFGVGALAALGALYLSAKPVVSEFEDLATISSVGGVPTGVPGQQSLDVLHDAELLAIAGTAIGGGVLLHQRRQEIEYWGLVDDLELDYQAKVGAEELHRETVRYLRAHPQPPHES